MGFEPMTSRLTTDCDYLTAPTVHCKLSGPLCTGGSRCLSRPLLDAPCRPKMDRRPGLEPGFDGSKPPVLLVAPSPNNLFLHVLEDPVGVEPTHGPVCSRSPSHLATGPELGRQGRTRTSIGLSNSQAPCQLGYLPENLVAAAGFEPALSPGFNRSLYRIGATRPNWKGLSLITRRFSNWDRRQELHPHYWVRSPGSYLLNDSGT